MFIAYVESVHGWAVRVVLTVCARRKRREQGMGEPDDAILAVNAVKAQANAAFGAKKYHEANDLYTSALTLIEEASGQQHAKKDVESAAKTNGNDVEMADGSKPADVNTEANAKADAPGRKELSALQVQLLSNRAITRLKLEEYGWAIEDASRAIEMDPTFIKAYYRRGSAKYAIGRYKEALADFRVVAKLHNDKDNMAKMKDCEKRVREAAFAKAIDADDILVGVAKTIDLSTYTVDDSYTGPRLEEDEAGMPVASAAFVEQLIETFKAQKKLHIRYALQMLLQIETMLKELPNVVTVPVTGDNEITVCGDTHGQFYDLLEIFRRNGAPSKSNPYVFNGDFVDRGSFSVEVILTLFAYKLHEPDCMHLTRGNHESTGMNKIYGFEGEVRSKYTETCFRLFSEVFRALPLAYILDGSSEPGGKRAFVVHGGLFSKDDVLIEHIQALNRNCEPDSGLIAEMLWSDPQTEPGRGVSKRGIGVAFGPDVTHAWCDANNIALIVRSHEMKDEGYEIEADGRLITVFSAPNYVDQMGNKGAYIRFRADMKPDIKQFTAVPHPNVRAMQYAPNAGMYGLVCMNCSRHRYVMTTRKKTRRLESIAKGSDLAYCTTFIHHTSKYLFSKDTHAGVRERKELRSAVYKPNLLGVGMQLREVLDQGQWNAHVLRVLNTCVFPALVRRL
ncbi:Serine/threonine-protein phosphatase 5 [Porphyridium purpureum]|uniref:protein-serine/threonine phosphatase n=1 Tax=Porphyridium purpureum TaxID=35688 RepID=A0A5J4YH44_PORPP|nr:Serine/threonine-protein phosphatase 5 [Porphyridium purpureum]|eukprot:POR4967..scf270_19